MAAIAKTEDSRRESIPGPDLPWYRQLQAIRADFLGFLTQQAQLHGDLFCIRPTPFGRTIVLTTPALSSEVLLRRAAEFGKSKQTHFMVGKFLGQGLVLAEGDQHRQLRRMMQPAFGAREALAQSGVIERLTQRHTEAWKMGTSIDLEEEMTALSLSIITTVLIGSDAVDVGSEAADNSLNAAFRAFALAIGARFKSMPLPAWMPTKNNYRDRQALALVDQQIQGMIDKHLSAQAHMNTARIAQNSVFSTLVTHLQKNGQIDADSRRIIRDQMATLLFAGHETIAKVLSWSLYLLLKHPEEMHTTREDIQRGGSYLDCVIKEAMRLYPPVWVFDRSPLQDTTLGGYCIYPKDTIYLSPYLLHRQERYFADANRFRPQRFADGMESHLPAGCYMPFGMGPRACIGQSLAWVEARLILNYLLKHFDFDWVDANQAEEVRASPNATLSPSMPIKLKVQQRH